MWLVGVSVEKPAARQLIWIWIFLDFWILDFGFVSGEIEHVVGGSEC